MDFEGKKSKCGRVDEGRPTSARRKWSPESGRLRVIFADVAYGGQLVACVREFFGRQGTRLSMVPRLGHGFRLLAKRWVAQRTFS